MRPYDKFYFDHLFSLQYIEDFRTVWLFPNHVSVGGLPIIIGQIRIQVAIKRRFWFDNVSQLLNYRRCVG